MQGIWACLNSHYAIGCALGQTICVRSNVRSLDMSGRFQGRSPGLGGGGREEGTLHFSHLKTQDLMET